MSFTINDTPDLSILYESTAALDLTRESVAGEANPSPIVQLPTPQMRKNRLDQSRSRGSTPVSTTRSIGGNSPKVTNIDDLIPASALNDANLENTTFSISAQFGNFNSSLVDRDTHRKKIDVGEGFYFRDWLNKIKAMPDVENIDQLPMIFPDELAKHNKPGDYWIAIAGNVYNVTDYVPFHPGGKEMLTTRAGTDATTEFNQMHSFVNHQSLLGKYLVGYYLKPTDE